MKTAWTLHKQAQAAGLKVGEFVRREVAKRNGNVRQTAIDLGVYDRAIYYHLRKTEEAQASRQQ